MNKTKSKSANKLIVYSLILGFLGFLVAAYLTILHFKNIVPPCSVTENCETVLTSVYATIGPVPIALLGVLFYLAIMTLCILIITDYKKLFLDLFYGLSAVGFAFSIVLILIQAYILNAYCQYCLASEAISTGIILLAFLDFRERNKKN